MAFCVSQPSWWESFCECAGIINGHSISDRLNQGAGSVSNDECKFLASATMLTCPNDDGFWNLLLPSFRCHTIRACALRVAFLRISLVCGSIGISFSRGTHMSTINQKHDSNLTRGNITIAHLIYCSSGCDTMRVVVCSGVDAKLIFKSVHRVCQYLHSLLTSWYLRAGYNRTCDAFNECVSKRKSLIMFADCKLYTGICDR